MELEFVLIVVVLLEAVGILGLLLNNRDLKEDNKKLQNMVETWGALNNTTPGKYIKNRKVRR